MSSVSTPVNGNTVRLMKAQQVVNGSPFKVADSANMPTASTKPVPNLVKKIKKEVENDSDVRVCAQANCGRSILCYGRCPGCGDLSQATQQEEARWRYSGLTESDVKLSPCLAVQAMSTMDNFVKAQSPDPKVAKSSPLFKGVRGMQTPTPIRNRGDKWEKRRTHLESPMPKVSEIPKLKKLVNKGDPEQIFSNQIKIGSGADGEVFSAIDTRVPEEKKHLRKVAIKKIEVTDDNEDDLATEISLMKECRHENVVGFKDAFLVGSRVWIVMEFVRAGALTDLVLKAPDGECTEEIMAYIMREILLALEFMHKNHRLHRDIKSDNVLMSTRGFIKLADFGFAAQLSEDRNKRSTVCGTPYWMAPELIEGKVGYGPGVDIWSTAILLRELMEREPPYYREAPTRALLLIMQQGLPPLQNPTKWSQELLDFLNNALKMNPEERWTASQLLDHPWIRKAASRKQGPKQLIAKVMDIKAKEKKTLQKKKSSD